MTLEQEQMLIDYIRANDGSSDRAFTYPLIGHCGHRRCQHLGICMLVELRSILNWENGHDLSDAEFTLAVLKMYDNRGLTEFGNVPAWKAESWATSPAGVQIPHPLPEIL